MGDLPRSWLILLLLPMLWPGLIGCAGSVPSRPTELVIAPGRYEAAFEAAKQAVLDHGFELERVDARSGILTTDPKGSGGLATPWDAQQSSLDQEVQDLINQQQRRVRITFVAATAPGAPLPAPAPATPLPATADVDLRHVEGPTTARIEVAVDRIHKPGWRVETTSVQQSRRWRDPDAGARGIAGQYAVPWTLDPALADRLARRIARDADGAALATAPQDQPRPVERAPEPPRASRRSGGYWE